MPVEVKRFSILFSLSKKRWADSWVLVFLAAAALNRKQKLLRDPVKKESFHLKRFYHNHYAIYLTFQWVQLIGIHPHTTFTRESSLCTFKTLSALSALATAIKMKALPPPYSIFICTSMLTVTMFPRGGCCICSFLQRSYISGGYKYHSPLEASCARGPFQLDSPHYTQGNAFQRSTNSTLLGLIYVFENFIQGRTLIDSAHFYGTH